MTDLASRESASSLLSSMPGLTVDARTCERGSYVIVECDDAAQAMSVYEIVMLTDSEAELIHSTTSPRGIAAVRDRMATSADGDLLDA